jgi:hypothetical protein
LLLYVRAKKLTGSLVFADRGADRPHAEIFLESGRVRRIRTQRPVYLGNVLYELGLIDAETMNRTLLQMAQSRSLMGVVLRGSGALDANALQRGLTEQTERKLEQVISLPRSDAWSFHTGVDALASFGGDDWPLVDCLGAVWRGLRESPFFDSIDASVARARTQPFVLKREAEGSLSRLSEEEAAMVRAFQGGTSMAEISCGLSENAKTRLFYFLLLTNVLAPVASGGTGPASARAPVPAPPESASRIPRSDGPPSQPMPRRADSTGSMRIPGPPASTPAPRISARRFCDSE